jgi:hypothetical protein
MRNAREHEAVQSPPPTLIRIYYCSPSRPESDIWSSGISTVQVQDLYKWLTDHSRETVLITRIERMD